MTTEELFEMGKVEAELAEAKARLEVAVGALSWIAIEARDGTRADFSELVYRRSSEGGGVSDPISELMMIGRIAGIDGNSRVEIEIMNWVRTWCQEYQSFGYADMVSPKQQGFAEHIERTILRGLLEKIIADASVRDEREESRETGRVKSIRRRVLVLHRKGEK